MLTDLSIRDVVLIEALDLGFGEGLGVLTGETGAGKSILLDALGLALGGRGDSGLVRHGAAQAVVTATFDAPAPESPLALLFDENGVEIERGEPLTRRALFFTTGQTQQSELARALGCTINDKGTVHTGKYETTHLSGLYVAGDASRAVQWVVVAAAEGAEAAFAINSDLLKEDLS